MEENQFGEEYTPPDELNDLIDSFAEELSIREGKPLFDGQELVTGKRFIAHDGIEVFCYTIGQDQGFTPSVNFRLNHRLAAAVIVYISRKVGRPEQIVINENNLRISGTSILPTKVLEIDWLSDQSGNTDARALEHPNQHRQVSMTMIEWHAKEHLTAWDKHMAVL